MLTLKIALLVASYLLGSVSTALIIGRLFYNTDIRKHGSGNAGATNAGRVLGKKAGIVVFIFDAIKGFLGVNLVLFSSAYISHSDAYINFQILLGLTAVLGHIFPVYYGFKGGKGVATFFGVFIAIAPQASLIVMAVFAVSLLLTKYVSLSSMLAAFSFPVFLILVKQPSNLNLVLFGFIAFVLLLITHQKNIERLARHEEHKVGFLTKKYIAHNFQFDH